MPKHKWIKNSYDNDPSKFAAEKLGSEFHNGPKCSVCGFEFCRHCYPEGWETDCGTKSLGSDDSQLDQRMLSLNRMLRGE